MNLVRRLFPFRTCTIDIKDGERALQRPCLLYHIKRCQGPCIEAISKDDYRADIDQVELFLEGRQETARQGAPARDGRRRRADGVRAGGASCATRSGRSSGRWRARRWRPSPGPSSTCVGLARQDNQAAVQLFVIRDGKMIGRDVFLLDAAREATDDEVLAQLPRAVLRARDVASRARSTCRAASPTPPTSRRSWPSGAAGRVRLRVPQRGEKRELMALATRNAAETLAREQARWLADQGKTLAALEELADALGLPGPPLRIECYDITNFQGSRVGRQHGRVRGGQAAHRRVPAVPDQDASRARTTSPATRRCCAAGSGAPRRARRGARRSAAGRCPTS